MVANFFTSCWAGRAALWQAFWLCGVLGMAIVLALFAYFGKALSAFGVGPNLSALLQVALLVGYASFSSVGVWRCAKDPKGSSLHALARVYAALSLISWLIVAAIALLFRS